MGDPFVTIRSGRRFACRRSRRAYSLLEVLITVLIIQIISGMVMVNVGSVQRGEKLSRGCEQVLVALRYARILAMSSGQPAGVEFNAATNTFRVFQGTAAATVSNSLIPGGSYSVTFSTSPELSGVKISNVTIANAATDPYRVTFGTLGGTTNNGYVTLNYGTQEMRINIPLVGEAKVSP